MDARIEVPVPTASSAFRQARCLVIGARVRPYLSILAEVRNWKGLAFDGQRARRSFALPALDLKSTFRQANRIPRSPKRGAFQVADPARHAESDGDQAKPGTMTGLSRKTSACCAATTVQKADWQVRRFSLYSVGQRGILGLPGELAACGRSRIVQNPSLQVFDSNRPDLMDLAPKALLPQAVRGCDVHAGLSRERL